MVGGKCDILRFYTCICIYMYRETQKLADYGSDYMVISISKVVPELRHEDTGM